MNIQEAIKLRHSVRSYTDRPLEGEVLERLQKLIAQCNEEGKLDIQLSYNDSGAFEGGMAHYGKFKGVRNHVALIGQAAADLDERCGYYGERIVLEAQMLGLNTCWVGLTYNKKGGIPLKPGQKRVCVLALGYGEIQGVAHKVKPLDSLCRVQGGIDAAPAWFRAGIEAAQLAPTAMNQQKFTFSLLAGSASGRFQVQAKAGLGAFAKVDLGIVKYHFEVAANAVSSDWSWA